MQKSIFGQVIAITNPEYGLKTRMNLGSFEELPLYEVIFFVFSSKVFS